jgi:hypothetical protein
MNIEVAKIHRLRKLNGDRNFSKPTRMKFFVSAAALSFVVCGVPSAEAGVDLNIHRGGYNYDYSSVMRVRLSPYDEAPYTRMGEMRFELLPETEVDPYKPAHEWLPASLWQFWTPPDRLWPSDWETNFRVTRCFECREFSLRIPRRGRLEPRFNGRDPQTYISATIGGSL